MWVVLTHFWFCSFFAIHSLFHVASWDTRKSWKGSILPEKKLDLPAPGFGHRHHLVMGTWEWRLGYGESLHSPIHFEIIFGNFKSCVSKNILDSSFSVLKVRAMFELSLVLLSVHTLPEYLLCLVLCGLERLLCSGVEWFFPSGMSLKTSSTLMSMRIWPKNLLPSPSP